MKMILQYRNLFWEMSGQVTEKVSGEETSEE